MTTPNENVEMPYKGRWVITGTMVGKFRYIDLRGATRIDFNTVEDAMAHIDAGSPVDEH